MGSLRPANRRRAILALVGANVIWGGSVVASKAALADIPPVTLACLRLAVALVLLLPLVMRGGGRPASGRAPLLLGLTGVALFCLGQNLSLHFTSATNAALINGGIPLLTTLLAAVVLGERLGSRRVAGLCTSVVGVAVIVLSRDGAGIEMSVVGDGLALASATSFAVYAVIGRRTFANGGALALVAGSTRYGLLLLLPAAVAELTVIGIDRFTVRDLVLLLYLGAGCSALAFVLLGYGLTHLDASYGAVFGNVKPLVGVGLAVFLLGEALAATQLVGGTLLLAGVVLAGSRATAALPARRDRSQPVTEPAARLCPADARTT